MNTQGRARVLCVDDEPSVLQFLRDMLRRRFDVTTVTSAHQGLAEIERDPSFAIVLSDMRMPVINGARFLALVRLEAPDAVRVLLTGQADIDAAIAAINEGHIFRLLLKPCPLETLLGAFAAAVGQHRLIISERVLLEQTLHGSIKALIDVLALVNPGAFDRAQRLKRHAGELARELNLADAWDVEMAALLSQLGCSTLPQETAEKYYSGRPLDREENALVDELPLVAERLVGHIPRLERACAILGHQTEPCQGGRPSSAGGQPMLLGARILKLAHDFDLLESQGLTTDLALSTLKSRSAEHDPDLLDAFARLRGAPPIAEILELALGHVQLGMTFAADVLTYHGALLAARGDEVTPSLLGQIRGLRDEQAREPVRVLTPARDTAGSYT